MEDNRPYSLIRLGDGENTLLQSPKFCSELRLDYVLSRALEHRGYSADEKKAMRDGLVQAIEGSDIVGMYPSSHPNPLCRVYLEHLTAIQLKPDQIFCYPTVHFYLQQTGVIRQLVKAADYVTLVGGRNVLGAFTQWSQTLAEQLLVPSERAFRLSGEIAPTAHYPERFREVCASIKKRPGRHLFLVGAGVIGKYYCKVARDVGGIAIDIGSVFDYWADIPTREGYPTVIEGELQLRRPAYRPALGLYSEALKDTEQGVEKGGLGTIVPSFADYVAIFNRQRLEAIDENLPLAAFKCWQQFLALSSWFLIDLNKPESNHVAVREGDALAILGLKGDLRPGDADEIRSSMDKARTIFFEDFRIVADLELDLSRFKVFDLKLVSSTHAGNSAGFLLKSQW